MENVREVIKEIKTNLSQKSSSSKDEIRVMKAMLNDKEYEAGVYGNGGLESTYNPSRDARVMMSNVIASTVKINTSEASELMEEYEFKKSDAETMINVGKEFINAYLDTGRKLPLGKRELSNVSLIRKDVDEGIRNVPKKVGINEDGTPRYGRGNASVKPHKSVKVISQCPPWVK